MKSLAFILCLLFVQFAYADVFSKEIYDTVRERQKDPSWQRNVFTEAYQAAKSGDYETAFRLWKPLADKGNANAQYNIGVMYDETGYGVIQDYREAIRYYTLAANQGHVIAQYNLGWHYYSGEGVSQSHKEAATWFTKSAEQGYMDAQSEFGSMYYQGDGVSQDYKKALKWLTLAAKQGDAPAQYEIGTMYSYGHGVDQDYQRAHIWFNLASLTFPPGKERDEAIESRQQAAQNLLPEQQRELALMYFQRESAYLPAGYMNPGVPVQMNQVMDLLHMAAEQGLGIAQSDLGDIYMNGVGGVGKDALKAKQWFEMAAKKGLAHAQYEVGYYYDSGLASVGIQDYEKALKWYELSAKQGLVEAMIALGLMYENGKGTSIDHVSAYMWYDIAARIGSRVATADRSTVATKMTRKEISKASALARGWLTHHN